MYPAIVPLTKTAAGSWYYATTCKSQPLCVCVLIISFYFIFHMVLMGWVVKLSMVDATSGTGVSALNGLTLACLAE